MTERYLALLRGINVGGKNLIGKDDLRRCFEELGFERVRTYIQSGNVLFRATAADVAELNTRVEQGLSDRFAYAARSVVLSYAAYAAALAAAPTAWGAGRCLPAQRAVHPGRRDARRGAGRPAAGHA